MIAKRDGLREFVESRLFNSFIIAIIVLNSITLGLETSAPVVNSIGPLLHVIDTGPELLGADDTPDPDNYIFDGLHLSDDGYAIWARLIRSRLLADLGPGPGAGS